MKYNYIAWFGWYLFIAMAGFGFFVAFYSVGYGLYFSIFMGCFTSVMGAAIIPPLKIFKIRKELKGGKKK